MEKLIILERDAIVNMPYYSLLWNPAPSEEMKDLNAHNGLKSLHQDVKNVIFDYVLHNGGINFPEVLTAGETQETSVE